MVNLLPLRGKSRSAIRLPLGIGLVPLFHIHGLLHDDLALPLVHVHAEGGVRSGEGLYLGRGVTTAAQAVGDYEGFLYEPSLGDGERLKALLEVGDLGRLPRPGSDSGTDRWGRRTLWPSQASCSSSSPEDRTDRRRSQDRSSQDLSCTPGTHSFLSACWQGSWCRAFRPG